MPYNTHTEVREQFPLPPCVSQGSNSSYQAWKQTTFTHRTVSLSHWPLQTTYTQKIQWKKICMEGQLETNACIILSTCGSYKKGQRLKKYENDNELECRQW